MRQPLRLMALLLTLAALLRPGNLWAQCVIASTGPDKIIPSSNSTDQKTAIAAVAGTNCPPVGQTTNTAGSIQPDCSMLTLPGFLDMLPGWQGSITASNTLAPPRSLYRKQGFY